MIEVVALLLIAFNRPVGGGTASLVARFDTETVCPIPAAFVGHAETVPVIEWFLDGDGIFAPLAVSQFVLRPQQVEPCGLLRGEYLFGQQGVTKPTMFRSVIRTSPPRDVRLLLFLPDHFDAAWKQLKESGLAVSLSGELPDLRELLNRHSITWREANLGNSDTIDRNGLLIAQYSHDAKHIPLPGMAKFMALYNTGSLAFTRFF